MTPEERATDALREAGIIGLPTSPALHSIIAVAVRDALTEARSLCTYIPDRDRISDMMIGGPRSTAALETTPAAPINTYGTSELWGRTPPAPGDPPIGVIITCFVCEGIGSIGSVTCHACNGRGQIQDSGPPPDPNPGLVAFKPCGCAVDWIGTGADDEFRRKRIQLWSAQGYRSQLMDFAEAGPLITLGAACAHDNRATPRASSAPLDLSELPPGGGA